MKNLQAKATIQAIFPFMAVAIFATQLGMGIISPLLPVYAQSLGATGLWIGVIASSYAVSRALCMPYFGWLSDHRGRKLFLSIGLIASAGLSFAYVAAPDVGALTIVRLFHGAASALIIPISTAYIGDLAPVGREGRWMGYSNTAFFIGFGAGPMLGGFVADQWSISLAFNIQGVMNVLAFLAVVIFIPDLRPTHIRGKQAVPFREMFTSGVMRGLLSYRTIYEAALSSVMTFLPIYVAIHLGMGKTELGILIAANLIGMSLLQIYTGRFADRFSRRNLVVWGGLATFVLIATITFATSFWMLLSIMMVRAVSSALSMPAIAGLTVVEGRKYGQGAIQAVTGFATSAGNAVGPIVAGLVSDAWDVSTVFYFAAGLGVSGTIVFSWFTRSYVQAPQPAPAAATTPNAEVETGAEKSG